MKNFNYKITDDLGIHARPAGLLVKEAGKYSSKIQLICGEKSVEAKKLLGVMGMGIKCKQTVTITAEGEDEAAAIEGMKAFFQENL
ncbi:HPr family phosphocarrier protein [Anaerosacchariphilus polymeriproducens]|uniref:HPr family phosphocarrier protein n=1 Tax=Anaerosacchariphilus polymeriproducens TaxID=1812858 RepID=A0A371AWF5_9FIRM|nr:HPr family phosphocarrier protein [Anaerosacchariphilus polymeriproducens]RDU23915.1 HPr family phosphocarrier protein [Anaerosacchariphilus polymeriproducens]